MSYLSSEYFQNLFNLRHFYLKQSFSCFFKRFHIILCVRYQYFLDFVLKLAYYLLYFEKSTISRTAFVFLYLHLVHQYSQKYFVDFFQFSSSQMSAVFIRIHSEDGSSEQLVLIHYRAGFINILSRDLLMLVISSIDY